LKFMYRTLLGNLGEYAAGQTFQKCRRLLLSADEWWLSFYELHLGVYHWIEP
jgi:hypothetical protein